MLSNQASRDEDVAQRVEYAARVHNHIDAVTWRRFASGAGVLAFLALAVSVILANRYEHDVFVFRDTPGGLIYAGKASEELTPSNFDIASQLGKWVQAYRDVPSDDAAVDQNVLLLEDSTADIGDDHALSDMKSWMSTNNPKTEHASFTRNVRPDVDAMHQPGTNTWNMTWIEDTTLKNGGVQPPSIHHGVIVVLPDPRLPTDNEQVNFNPAGVIVARYELH